MSKNATYYLIWDKIVGKQEEGKYYIFKNEQWEPDNENMIMDRLVGYDPSEPPGSPYGFGNDSVMAEMDEISYEEAVKMIRGNI